MVETEMNSVQVLRSRLVLPTDWDALKHSFILTMKFILSKSTTKLYTNTEEQIADITQLQSAFR